jgi:hypothetical protein
MWMNKEEFFDKYGFHRGTTKQEFRNFLLEISSVNKPLLGQVVKNILILRMLDIAKNNKWLKATPNDKNTPLFKVFVKAHFMRFLNRVSVEMNIDYPKVHITGASCLVTVVSIVVWVIFLLIFLSRHIELLFSGLVVLIVPFYLIVIMAPYIVMRLIFPGFFALVNIKEVSTFGELIDAMYKLNHKHLREDNFEILISELIVIQNRD